jgi:hypothetical protein
MTAWTPGTFCPDLFGVLRRYLPPPPGMPASDEWGDEDTVRERFDGLAATLEMERRTLLWEAESPEALGAAIDQSAPAQAAARDSLSAEDYEAMKRDQVEVLRRWAGGDGPVAIEAEYLVIVARRRG